MAYRNKGGAWLGAMTLLTGVLTGGCNSETASVTQEVTTLVSQAVESTSDASDAVEVASLMRGLNALHSEAVEGFHCDSSPDVTNVTVCGKSLPATVHLEWTECAAPGGGKGGGRGKGPRFGPSSGKVDITYTYAAADDCSGTVTQDQAVTFQISRTDEDGAVSTEQGTTTSSALLVAEAPPEKKSTQADVTRVFTDQAGTVVSSVHLNGAMSVDFSSDSPPVRTLNGAYSESFLDGSTGTVTLAHIVRPPRDVCPWPISGTLTRATSRESSHSLVFGPDCGSASLDGTAVDLSAHRLPEPRHP